jgi:formylglycine-generating enzyme required for sulfatase activity
MRKSTNRIFCFCTTFFLFLLVGCAEETSLSKLTTAEISNLTEATVLSGGEVLSDGGASVTDRGVCWSTFLEPTISDHKTNDSLGLGTFESRVQNLTPGTTYHLRAFATNAAGTSYGRETTFTTKTLSVSTTNAYFIMATSAISGGSILSNADSSSLTIQARGICWNTFPNPTIADSVRTSGAAPGNYTTLMENLKPLTTYYVRAFVTNSRGTFYGSEINFTTQSGLIALNTEQVIEVTAHSALLKGTISGDGGAAITDRGFCWNTNPNPTLEHSNIHLVGGAGMFQYTLSDLQSGTTYYFRAYATNSTGTCYGEEFNFKTNGTLAYVTTNPITDITSVSASSGGLVTSDGSALISARGVCWSTTENPTIDLLTKTEDGTGPGNFSSTMTGLHFGTTYHVRAYVTNPVGTSYGADVTFRTSPVIPTVETVSISAITAHSISMTGKVWNSGGADINTRGACCSTTAEPTTQDIKMESGFGMGTYTVTLSGLTANTTYTLRSFASNSVGFAYGNSLSFTTLGIPAVSTSNVSNVTITSAQCGGSISFEDGNRIQARGICWSTSQNPTVDLSTKTVDGSGGGEFTGTMTQLPSNTKIYVRAYATYESGTSYGAQLSFTTDQNVAIDYVNIPAGSFIMGSPTTETDRNSDETQHQVNVSAFKMSKYEITNAQYAAFLNAKNIGSNALYTSGSYPIQVLVKQSSIGSYNWGINYIGEDWVPVVGYEKYPAIYISWYGATEFAKYVGGRLPTEAEWEYACRAGTTTAFNTGTCLSNTDADYLWNFPYGSCINTIKTPLLKSKPVGSYSPNAWGLYDMHGNVIEWCSDQTSGGGASGIFYSTRGGGWWSRGNECRSAYRTGANADGYSEWLGFRVIKNP